MPKLCFQLLLPQVHHGGSGHPGVAELLGPRSLYAFPVESFFMEPRLSHPQPMGQFTKVPKQRHRTKTRSIVVGVTVLTHKPYTSTCNKRVFQTIP